MTTFEISGNTASGGIDESHNQGLLDQVQDLEKAAIEVGKSLGMSSVDRCYVSGESTSYGFRYALSSEEKFDAKGVEAAEKVPVNALIENLG